MVDGVIQERTGLVNRVAEYLRSGFDVNVVSPPGNGGSWFLRSLQASLEESGAEVVFLPRTGEQNSIPSAFSQFLVGEDPAGNRQLANSRALSTGSAVSRLVRTVGNKALVLIAESPQTLTPALRSLLTMYRQQARVNVIALSPQAQPRLLEDSSVILVTLPTLSLETLRTTLHAKLGAPINAATLGRVYAKSGGLIALAVAICETARIEGRLQFSDGEWCAKDNLWSDALIPLMMRYTEQLELDEMQGLETLAEAGVIDACDAERFIGDATLDRLERRGIVVIHHSQNRRWMSINPPLLQEMLTHTTTQTRQGLPGTAETPSPVLEPRAAQPARYRTRTRIAPLAPSFLSLLARNRRVEMEDAATAFQDQASRENALRYTMALVDERADPLEILTVIAAGEAATGSDYHLAELIRWKAWLLAYCLGDLARAESVLTDPGVPAAYRQMLTATRIEMLVDLAQIPSDAVEVLQLEADAPEEAVPVICHALAVVHLVQGQPELAAAALDHIVLGSDEDVDHIRDVLSGFVALLLGEFDRAFEIACRGFERAKSELDEAALREHTHLLTLLLMVRGRREEIMHLRELFDALGGRR
ncbi:hypothetical protein G7067_00320 [Leucobacter insecticola]|uniref:Tetratricopeptide repeat protein n=1 Tax=Leucobacter insecticola TaxID=2714934 RepID=A0A6G8FG39_9MICO|nr:hypothetical protein [Leucobacter insecticola]QIM15209.1 hypothetical protein G7067_00320 [Leucobacter insecticola]